MAVTGVKMSPFTATVSLKAEIISSEKSRGVTRGTLSGMMMIGMLHFSTSSNLLCSLERTSSSVGGEN